ncbi:Ig-like domain-containing protein [Moritella sp. 36]|uniref:Ig-like domain-containing protein n=1 Tax=Moritella sp. 36 TaxID=2746233 RepID=UPI001BABAF23|nr:Ig-like domain-containing protein [Moritella sp. 36]QUM90043.1 Ig-like domain-containing protein [Moritella sp. 36]
MIRFTSWLLLFCTLGILTACGGGGSSAGSSEAPKPSDKKTLTSIQINIKQATTFGNIKHDIAAGFTQSYDAVGYYSDGATQVITDDVTWQVDNEALAVITNGKVEGLKSGVVMITASKGNVISPKTRLRITDAVPLSISIDLKAHEMLQGQKQDISLTATLSDDSVSRVTDGVTWITSAGIEVSGGKVVAMQAGSATLTGSYRGLSSSIDLVVKPAVLENLKIEVKSNEINLPKGLTKKITVKGIYSNDESKDLSDEVTLVIDDESIAHLNKQGELVAIKEGNTRVHAEYLSIQSPSIPVVVTAETLKKLVISADESINKGLSTQIHITGEFTDGKQGPFTGEVNWFVKSIFGNGSEILTVVQGQATAIGKGSVEVWAQADDVTSESIWINVEDEKLQKLILTVDTSNIIPNQTTNYKVMGQYSDNTEVNLTRNGLIISDSENVKVDLIHGEIVGKHPGHATVTASMGDISSDPITITVTKAKLTNLLIDVNNFRLHPKQTFSPNVYAYYDRENTPRNVNTMVTWYSDNASIITVDDNNLVAKSPGRTTVWCTLDGIESDHVELEVTDAIPTDLDITPKNTVTKAGYSVLYKAVATYSDNSTKDVTNQVEWKSSDIEKASFIGNTLHTQNAGRVTIHATFGTLTDNASLTISDAKLVALFINPKEGSIAVGQTYTVTGIASNSSYQNFDIDVNKFNWKSANEKVLALTSPGKFKAMSEGYSKITAIEKTGSKVKSSRHFTVGHKALNDILINATSFKLISGTSMKLSATGIYTDGTNDDISGQVEWSSNSEAITIDKDSIAHAQDDSTSSNTEISAKLGDIDNTATFNISNSEEK